MFPVLDLHPMLRPASLIRPVASLRHKTFKAHLAGRPKQIGADLAAAFGPACQQAFKVDLAQMKGELPQIVVALDEDVEGAKLNFIVMPPGVQRAEIGDAVDAQHHRLAIDDEPLLPVLERGLDDPRIQSA